MAVIFLVALVIADGPAGALVGLAIADGPIEVFQVEAIGLELLGQLNEHFGMAGKVAFVHIIDRVNNAPAEELIPGAVDHGLGEKRIARGDNPLGEDGPIGFLRIELGLLPLKELGGHDLGPLGLVIPLALAPSGPLEDRHLGALLGGGLRIGRQPRLREECRHAPVIVLLDLDKWMIVALGALQADAKEHLRDVVGDLVGGGIEDEVGGGPVGLLRADRGEKIEHHLVERLVVLESVGQPGLHGLVIQPTVIRLARQHQAGPHLAQVGSKTRMLEKLVDDLGPLVGVGTVEKIDDLFRRRNNADEIEINTAEEFAVVGEGGRLDAFLNQSGLNRPIDGPGQSGSIHFGGRPPILGRLSFSAAQHPGAANQQTQGDNHSAQLNFHKCSL